MAEKYAGPDREPFEKRLARSIKIRGEGKVQPVGGDMYRTIAGSEVDKNLENIMKYDEANKIMKRRASLENVTVVGEFSSADGAVYKPKVVKHKAFSK